jgi:hypothetical protein
LKTCSCILKLSANRAFCEWAESFFAQNWPKIAFENIKSLARQFTENRLNPYLLNFQIGSY